MQDTSAVYKLCKAHGHRAIKSKPKDVRVLKLEEHTDKHQGKEALCLHIKPRQVAGFKLISVRQPHGKAPRNC